MNHVFHREARRLPLLLAFVILLSLGAQRRWRVSCPQPSLPSNLRRLCRRPTTTSAAPR